MFHTRWWDYSDKPFNLHGRVYLNGFLAFGGATVVLIKWLNPYVTSILLELPKLWIHSLSGIFLSAYMIDNILTFSHVAKLETHLHSVSERYEQIKKQTAIFKNPDARMELFFQAVSCVVLKTAETNPASFSGNEIAEISPNRETIAGQSLQKKCQEERCRQ